MARVVFFTRSPAAVQRDLLPGEQSDIIDEIRSVIADADVEPWLDAPNERLGGAKPRDLLGTDEEYRLRDLTRSIKHGTYS